jgi:hypothetical protein
MSTNNLTTITQKQFKKVVGNPYIFILNINAISLWKECICFFAK